MFKEYLTMTLFSKTLSDIIPVLTAHGMGKKQVFKSNKDLHNKLTQISLGTFSPGGQCEEHEPPTMYEYFFFIRGKGFYTINGQVIDIKENVFLEIPPKTKHSLKAVGNGNLEFVY